MYELTSEKTTTRKLNIVGTYLLLTTDINIKRIEMNLNPNGAGGSKAKYKYVI